MKYCFCHNVYYAHHTLHDTAYSVCTDSPSLEASSTNLKFPVLLGFFVESRTRVNKRGLPPRDCQDHQPRPSEPFKVLVLLLAMRVRNRLQPIGRCDEGSEIKDACVEISIPLVETDIYIYVGSKPSGGGAFGVSEYKI